MKFENLVKGNLSNFELAVRCLLIYLLFTHLLFCQSIIEFQSQVFIKWGIDQHHSSFISLAGYLLLFLALALGSLIPKQKYILFSISLIYFLYHFPLNSLYGLHDQVIPMQFLILISVFSFFPKFLDDSQRLRVFSFLLFCCYFFAGLSKLLSPTWFSGAPLVHLLLGLGFPRLSPLAEPLLTSGLATSFLPYFICGLELVVAFGFLLKKLRFLSIVVFACFHLAIFLASGINFFKFHTASYVFLLIYMYSKNRN